jgi:hypothetical protein
MGVFLHSNHSIPQVLYDFFSQSYQQIVGILMMQQGKKKDKKVVVFHRLSVC